MYKDRCGQRETIGKSEKDVEEGLRKDMSEMELTREMTLDGPR